MTGKDTKGDKNEEKSWVRPRPSRSTPVGSGRAECSPGMIEHGSIGESAVPRVAHLRRAVGWKETPGSGAGTDGDSRTGRAEMTEVAGSRELNAGSRVTASLGRSEKSREVTVELMCTRLQVTGRQRTERSDDQQTWEMQKN